jgi:hypothetical protein
VSLRLSLTILVLLAAAASFVLRRDTAAPAAAAGPPATAAQAAAAAEAPPAPLDPATIRDVFRYAQPPAPARPPAARRAAPTPEPIAAAPDPFRLVGLVHRDGRRLAAFSLAGEVVLAGEGELVGGALVLEVGDELVRLRRPDGSESRLALP